jgi:S1-C subfamily serine protease
MPKVPCICGARLNIPDKLAGQTTRCPKCSAPVQGPVGGEPTGDPATPSPREASRWKPRAMTAIGLCAVSLLGMAAAFLSRGTGGGGNGAEEIRRLELEVQAVQAERARLSAELARATESDALGALGRGLEEARERETALAREADETRGENQAMLQQVQELQAVLSRREEAASQPKVGFERGEGAVTSVDELVREHGDAVVAIKSEAGIGAGFFVSADGFIATNRHLVAGASRIEVHYVAGGDRSRLVMALAVLYASDPASDLVLLKIGIADPVRPAVLGPEEPMPALARAVAIGHPGTSIAASERSVSTGIYLGADRQIGDRLYIETNVRMPPGNSGAPLFSFSGRVIGVMTSMVGTKQGRLCYAVPASSVARLVSGSGGAFRIVQPPISPAPSPPTPPPPPVPKPVGKGDKPAENEFRPSVTISLGASIPDMFLSPDGAWLYLLNGSDGKVIKLDTSKREMAADEAPVGEGTVGMCMAPNGKNLYTFAAPQGYANDPKKVGEGKFQVIDPANLRVRSTFSAAVDPYDAEADDRGRLFVTSGSGQHTFIAVIDSSSRRMVAQWDGIYHRSLVVLHPDQKRLYAQTTGLSPGDIYCFQIPDDVRQRPSRYDSPYHGDPRLGGPFVIAPDGKMLVSSTGTVLRLAKMQADDLRFTGRVEQHVAAAAAGDTLLIATDKGTLGVYTLSALEQPKREYHVGKVLFLLAYDSKREVLYGIAAREKRQERGRWGVGDLLIYDLGK